MASGVKAGSDAAGGCVRLAARAEGDVADAGRGGPELADSSGNALVAIGIASTANGTTKTAHANPYSTRAPGSPYRLASTITTATDASWATSVSTPAIASLRTRGPTPAGNRHVGRTWIRIRRAGTTAVRTSASTPSVVPPDSRYSAEGGRWPSRFTYAPPTMPNTAYASTTTRLDSSGASAGAPNLRCDCKIPYSTTASP